MYANALGIALRPVVLSLSPTGCNVTQWSTCTTMKLTVDQASEIRRLYQSGMKQSYLAMKFGTTQQNVSRIVNGDRWSLRISRAKARAEHRKVLDAIAARGITYLQPKG